MNRSPERNEFRLERYRKKLAEDPNDEDAKAMIELYTDFDIQEQEDVLLPKKTNENALIEESLPIEKYGYYL